MTWPRPTTLVDARAPARVAAHFASLSRLSVTRLAKGGFTSRFGSAGQGCPSGAGAALTGLSRRASRAPRSPGGQIMGTIAAGIAAGFVATALACAISLAACAAASAQAQDLQSDLQPDLQPYLQPGDYVIEGFGCTNFPPLAHLAFDGRRFASRGVKCTLDPRSRAGDAYAAACTDERTPRAPETLRWTFRTLTHQSFSLNGASYRLCPRGAP
jgi:hypothetical protein